MLRRCLFTCVAALTLVSVALFAQEPDTQPPAKQDPPQAKVEPVRYKGILPANWKKLGLSDSQVQEIYKIQTLKNQEIDKLEAQIKELKAARDKEMKEVLSPEQVKKLEDILLGRDK